MPLSDVSLSVEKDKLAILSQHAVFLPNDGQSIRIFPEPVIYLPHI